MRPSQHARPLHEPGDVVPLVERIGDARYVLLGEASHGTHEYYWWRAEITRRLVQEHGFDFIAVEGDWPDCFAVNTWVRGLDGDGRDAEDVLAAFRRWPTWMWANEEVAELATWMRDHNRGRPYAGQVGFYGFDVYSLWESMRAIIDYLSEHEPDAVETAKHAFRCFEPYREDPHSYAWATRMVPTSCEEEVVALLSRICEDGAASGPTEEHRFAAEQNAAVARDAERYYRAMIRGGPESWNVRDTHMVDTLDRLMDRHGPDAKSIVWAHNTHIGDARATGMARDGLVNVGQLVRERHGRDDVVAVGFGGHRGQVIAGDAWGAPMDRMPVPDARPDSVEGLLHREIGEDALLVFPGDEGGRGWLDEVRPHRAIGVVYHPERERIGNYVPTVLGERYDAFCYLDDTSALRPLAPEEPAGNEDLETFPSGL